MKGILLAGGKGIRLLPVTRVISKQMMPVYDKPMIYYPLSVLMLAGIREILIISTPRDLPLYRDLLGEGHSLGLRLQYAAQGEPRGIAEAFIIGEEFIGRDRVALILGDNIFYGQGFSKTLEQAVAREGATIFGYHVNNPSDFGVVAFNSQGQVISIEEKPLVPKSRYAIPGLYFFDWDVVAMAKGLKPSARGELEITDINQEYLRQGRLRVELLGRGTAWLDTGTHKGLLAASNYVEAIQSRQGQYIACLEEIAYRRGYIDKNQLGELARSLGNSDYGRYLRSISEEVPHGEI
ncbi:MAG: glucose-1-phosphate thymidylyltransferase [delta proteobacterium ML8_F1]|nr:MAG: glucose-1-phosphate thymidylyltransferase [delta proteobacterium ML8_F1]